MADKAISDLIAASSVGLLDLFVLEQNNTAKKLTGQVLVNDLATMLDGHGGINDITYTAPVLPSLDGTLTITMADETVYTLTLTNGNGIASITQFWATSYTNDTEPVVWYETVQTMTTDYRYLWSYTAYAFDDGSTIETIPQVIGVYGDTGQAWHVHIKYASQYPTADSDMGDSPDAWIGIYSGVSETAPTTRGSYAWYQWKGDKGDTGTSITGVAKTSTSGVVDTYTITFSDGNTTTFNVTNGSNISTIAKTNSYGLTDVYTVTLTNGTTTTFNVSNGKGITSVQMIGGNHAAGTTDTYQINFNDGDSTTFTVYNGANGTGAVSSVAGIQAVNGDVPLILSGVNPPTPATVGQENQMYFDYGHSVLYICLGENDGTYTWAGAGVTVDAAMSTTSTNPVQNAVISTKVGTGSLNTTATNLSDAVNELDNEIGDVSTLTTTATDLAGAVNELSSDISTVGSDLADDISDINDTIGSTALPTTAQTLTGAIAELDGNIDDINANISATVKPNLLENWYFVGGGSQLGFGTFPINQRGQTTYSGAIPTFDRWRLSSTDSTITLNSSYLTLTNASTTTRRGMYQVLEDPKDLRGKTVTGSILLSDGSLYYGTKDIPLEVPSSNTTITLVDFLGSALRIENRSDGNIRFTIYEAASATLNIVAAFLELGNTQTLAHQKNGTWVLNELPNYTEEWNKCLPYLIVYNSGAQFLGFSSNAGTIILDVYIPTTLRGTPTITLSGVNWLRGNGNHYNTPTCTASYSFGRTGLVGILLGSWSISISNYIPYFVALGTLTISCEP